VYCDTCEVTKPTIKRTFFDKLPPLLLFSLRRFDFANRQAAKLNSRCTFPMRLNMKPYTYEEKEDAEYTYELRGVLVHTGEEQRGHYYALAQDHEEQGSDSYGRWFKFDDHEVSMIGKGSFGGGEVVESIFHDAVMLFYERCDKQQAMEDKEKGGEEKEMQQAMEQLVSKAAAAAPAATEPAATVSVEEAAPAAAVPAAVVSVGEAAPVAVRLARASRRKSRRTEKRESDDASSAGTEHEDVDGYVTGVNIKDDRPVGFTLCLYLHVLSLCLIRLVRTTCRAFLACLR